MSILGKIKENVVKDDNLIILADDIGYLNDLIDSIASASESDIDYDCYKNDEIDYMVEIKIPAKKVSVLKDKMRLKGYDLRAETRLGIFKRMVKIES